MLRLALSTVALAGVLATAHPTFSDPLRTATSEHAQATAAAAEQPAPSAPRLPPTSATQAPVGFGWG